jgi:putative peptidoglycan lipid II flippase
MHSSWLARRVKWARESTNGRVFTAAVMIAGLASVVKVASLGKEMLVARCFGAGDALDAYYVAFLLPSFFIGVIAGSCNEAFIPTYIEVRENEGIDAAQRVFSSVALGTLVVLIGLSIALAMSQGWLLALIGSGFGPAKLALTRVLLFILLAALSLSGLSALWKAVLNAHERFALTATAPIIIPLTIALLLLVSQPTWRLYMLGAGYVLGVAAELVINGYGMWRLGMPLVPHWYGFDWPVRQVLMQTLPAAAGAVLMGSTVLVDQSMAAMLPSGSVSAFNYANKLIPMLLGIGSSSLSMAVLPALSTLSANRDWRGMRRVVSSYTRLLLVVTVPTTVILIVFSEPIIRLFFQGGAFTPANAHLVARVQSLLCLELPFYAIAILYVDCICALKRNDILMWGTILSVVANVVLNYVFMKMFGLPGIALSTSAVYLIAFIFLRFMLSRALRQHETTTEARARTVPSAELSPEVV